MFGIDKMFRVIMRSRVAGSFQQDFFKNGLIRSLAVVISLFQQRNIDRSGRETGQKDLEKYLEIILIA